jgi:hypothetical protein
VRYEVLIAVPMKMAVFLPTFWRSVLPPSSGYENEDKAEYSPKTSVMVYQTLQCHIPENNNLQIDSCLLSVAGCSACNPGWFMDTEKGCLDVNECLINPNPCKRNEFCVNNDGSYTCLGKVCSAL